MPQDLRGGAFALTSERASPCESTRASVSHPSCVECEALGIRNGRVITFRGSTGTVATLMIGGETPPHGREHSDGPGDAGEMIGWFAKISETLQTSPDRAARRPREEASARRPQGVVTFGPIETRTPQMARVLREAAKVAPTDATVLLLGETGSGKEILSRAIHDASRRSARAFVAVNCAAFPDSLLEAEIFGIEAGVATGVTSRSGVLELAEGGTLFLDEIGNCPLSLQAKLLRVLENGRSRRIGGKVERAHDIRILAATNADLTRAIDNGEFRADLFFRLNVVTLRLPPLRDLPDDVESIAWRFLSTEAGLLGKTLSWAPCALARLRGHHWPGNVRELRNAVRRLAIMVDGGEIRADQVQQHLGFRSDGDGAADEHELILSYRRHMEQAARKVIADALRRTGTISGAARLLGLARQSLSVKCKQLGISVPST
ncbi:MAG: sigma-54-dependent Fis family transcriptional regulator [Candidatus Schekmanbacteria bacterium]|nr:sigma-54-dependent Fis family transcriptional regulator [Candidatus Schekmanbacteria bacterium]